MKKVALILIFLAPFLTEAKDVFFNRLEKLHNQDQKKCLEVSKRYMKWFPNNPAPHYFASIIYQERSTKSRTIQGEYRNVKKAIGYAMSFEKRDEENLLRDDLEWDAYRSNLTTQAFDVVGKLNEINETRFSQALMASLERFDDETDVVMLTVAPDVTEVETAKNTDLLEREVFDANSSKLFFGMPKGNEFVVSASLDGEQKLLGMINAERKRKGMEPLEWDENLARAARYHSYDLATQEYFNHLSHDRVNGELVKVGGTFERIKKFYNTSFVNSENIAAGNALPKDTYQQWYNSKGHYDNMFNKSSKKVGIGVYYDEDSPFQYYWTFCTAL